MKAEDLRKAILQAAVQGKLVPQDKNDEPASELLKRIQAEKKALMKEGKLKKEKPLPPISEDEIPYDLPDGWIWCRFYEITKIVGDGIHGTPEYDNKGDYYFINGNNLEKNTHRVVFTSMTKKANKHQYELYKKTLDSQTILLSINGTIGNIAFYNDEKVILGKSTAYINLLSDLDKYYISLFLQSDTAWLYYQNNHTGTTIKNLSLASIRSCPCPLPPLAEQQRIVAKVDELMAMCDELEAAEKELDALEDHFAEYLPKSILQTAMQGKLVPQDKNDEPATELLKRIQKEKVQLIKDGKLKKEKPLPPITEEEIPYDLPDGWVWCRLGDITELIMGQSPDGYNVSNNLGGMEFHQGKSCFTEKYLDVSEVNTTQCTKIAPANSVLLAVRAPVGKVNITRRKVCIGRGLCAIIPLGSMILDFVFYWMQSLEAELVSKATGTTFIAVTGEIVKKQLIPLPPLAEQKRIVSKVNELMTLCEDLKQARIMPIAKVVDRVIPFPATTYKHEPVGMAARGMADDLSAKAMQTIANLFEEED